MGTKTIQADDRSGAQTSHGNTARGLRALSRIAVISAHYMLAVIAISAVIACLFISLEIVDIHHKTLGWNAMWTNRVNQLVALRSAVSDAGLEVNAILKNPSPEEFKRLNTAYDYLDARLAALQSEITINNDPMAPAMKTLINDQINGILKLTALLRNNAVRELSGNGRNGQTPPSAIDTDRDQILVQDAITTATTYIRSEQVSQLDQSEVSSRYWVYRQYLVCAIAAPFMLALAALTVRALLRSQRTLKERERALDELHAYQTALNHHAIIAVTDAEGRITQTNEAFRQVSKFSEQEIIGQNHHLVDPRFHTKNFWNEMWQTISSGTIWHGEVCERAKDGSQYWVTKTVLPVLDEKGRPNSFISIATDITKQKQLETELRIAARTDKLTGLPNRAALADDIQRAIARTRRHPEFSFAVLFLDLDRFKSINDCLGHEAGDLLLREIASRLRLSLREEDVVAVSAPADGAEKAQQKCGEVVRLGGDEFVVLLDGLRTPADACIVADRILVKLAAPLSILGMQLYTSASIGIVTSEISNTSASEVLRDADIALYEAKLAGKGRYVVFDEQMRNRIKHRVSLESDLRSALENGQLLLHYQPLVCLFKSEVFSYEALIRWKHPQYGMVSPAEFIPIAEESGLIIPIGKWVLRESLRQLAQWRRTYGTAKFPRVHVNVSWSQLSLSDFPSMITGLLDEFGLEPDSLYLEITEGTLMQDPIEGARVIDSLDEIGVKLALDDFGTGYSSLSALHQFPVHMLKIDGDFVAKMMRGREYLAMVETIIALTQNLGMGVVAEGIETVEQLLTLESIDCQFGQGYLFTKPMPPEEVPNFSYAIPSKTLVRGATDKIQPASAVYISRTCGVEH
ncbi:MAG TPA: EAL domain-containing protein [Phycisphaerae bacterium]|nr:EAL domain-containing protein [Phycisphaerae bacterium]